MAGMRFHAMLLALGLLGFFSGGCGKVPTLEEAKQAVTETVQTPVVINNGKFEVSVGAPLSFSSCYVKTIAFTSGRPAVLQFASYKDPKSESFPSYFLRAELPSGVTSAAAGQKLAAKMFVQEKADGPVWHSPDGSSVELSITAADGKIISGSVVRGTLFNTDSGSKTDVTGTFEGAVQ